MFKINIEDEKILLEYLNSKDNLYRRREKILNELLEIEEKNNNFWELDSLYGQLFHNKYDSATAFLTFKACTSRWSSSGTACADRSDAGRR